MGLITLENVSKIYDGDVRALDDVSLEIKHGEWVSIMGPSGSGKSTMLNLIGCMDTPSKGVVKIDGIDISKLNKKELTKVRREKIGLVFQQFHLVPYLTAVENVMVAQYYHSMADEDEALKALERVGLGHRANHLPKELSGGEQQRVCIARALINYPKLILADEPTGNLDKENEQIVVNLFEELHKQGHSILMVTHDPKVGQLAERQIILEHGKKLKSDK
ncbi:GTPase [Orenia metallireducens]|jgi:putative ABC transport system ATP-binding protein|uniref:GTPase n=1 Tax=Orenia metallireducens TaxID=1413210 RepID=A0A1C0A9D0_9FIRM|nr:ABC transporter ATP-binding protein [Orenia metallireducens]OCL26901.1 GTPase [Orenia metallireducens]